MDMKRYKKTRYQNIYKSIKNQNYIIVVPGTRTTISKDEKQNKIFDIELALKLRDSKKLRISKKTEANNKKRFKEVWGEYYHYCNETLAYNSVHRKKLLYNAHINKLDSMKLAKITKYDIETLIKNASTTNNQKNRILIELKTFFSWCTKQEYIPFNPASALSGFKEEKKEMKYWLPCHLKTILKEINKDISEGTEVRKRCAYVTKMVILLGFGLGDRLGETRALRFCDVSREYKTITINHSIDYDPESRTFLKETKNEQSKRVVDVSDKLIDEIEGYKKFLIDTLGLDIRSDTIILTNPVTSKPYSDVALRKNFNYYIEKTGVPKIRMYDLRHTFVTTMLTEGWEVYAISKRIGHSNIQTTINTYGHISDKVRKEMAKTTDKYY